MMVYTIHHVLPLARVENQPDYAPDARAFHLRVGGSVWSGLSYAGCFAWAGAVPGYVHMDSKGMTCIRKMISGADFPIALAPEAMTYASKRVELETGTARFGFWAMEDGKSREERKVCILPVSTHYRWPIPAENSSPNRRNEKICGLRAELIANQLRSQNG